MVMRFNHAPTAGFEAIAGSKTDLRVVCSLAASVGTGCDGACLETANSTVGLGAGFACPRETLLLTGAKSQRKRQRLFGKLRQLCPEAKVIDMIEEFNFRERSLGDSCAHQLVEKYIPDK